ncbi:hypothetical protein AQUCO_02000276v1 [Aquilegia coerulea]|uniref:Uncharacterized protein n=1 Tax=Aquilegia coerulea TaxID=218851 RepID=A0A2G5DGR7_AQUCA|nr:hypothetical protein AQUCO_02000276v1 [Aquilegia coerulea]
MTQKTWLRLLKLESNTRSQKLKKNYIWWRRVELQMKEGDSGSRRFSGGADKPCIRKGCFRDYTYGSHHSRPDSSTAAAPLGTQ